MKKRYEILNLLKFAAILLIFNSHCDALYPVSSLATGGALGNSLFFVISGYLTKLDPEKPFGKYFLHRIGRLYLALWIATAAIWLIEGQQVASVYAFLRDMIYPTSYWFASITAVFLVLLYLTEKCRLVTAHFRLFSLGMLLLYILGYFTVVDLSCWSVETPGLTSPLTYFKCIHYFYIFCLGYVLKEKGVTELPAVLRSWQACLAGAVLAFILQSGIKLLMSARPALYCLQFISQAADLLFAVSMLCLCLQLEDRYCRCTGSGLRRAFAVLGGISFEMYTVQFIIIAACEGLPFPVSLLAALLFSAAFGWLLHQLVGLLLKIRLPGRKNI